MQTVTTRHSSSLGHKSSSTSRCVFKQPAGTGSALLIASGNNLGSHGANCLLTHVCVLLLMQGARRSTAPSGGGAAASGAGARARRTVEGEELAAGEGLALQSPDLLPHFVIDVSDVPCQTVAVINNAMPVCLSGAVTIWVQSQLASSACGSC